jgi:hypothetical protein
MADEHMASALAVEDLVIPQGASESATWPTPWLYGEGDPVAPPSGWPGSWTARMQIRDQRGPGSTVLATLHSSVPAEGVLLLDTSVEDAITYARVTPVIDPVTSAGWAWADSDEPAVWDLELMGGGRVIRLVEGSVRLSGEVTTVG